MVLIVSPHKIVIKRNPVNEKEYDVSRCYFEFSDGTFDYTRRKIWTAKTHTNHSTDKDELATLSTLTYWNGAYNGSNKSNLTYAHQGEIQCKPTVLYNNTSGTTGTVTLSETISNFSYIEIFFSKNIERTNNGITSVKVPITSATEYASLVTYNNDTAATRPQILTKAIKLNGTSITHQSGYYINFKTTMQVGASNEIAIYRVIGWK